MITKISEHFDIREFIPPDVFNLPGKNPMWFIDKRIVLFSEWLRVYLNKPVTINNWHIGGQFKNSGFRMPNDTTSAAILTAHKRGIAADLKVDGMTGEELRNIIRKNFPTLRDKFGLSTIEAGTPTWLHVDLRWTGQESLLEVPYM